MLSALLGVISLIGPVTQWLHVPIVLTALAGCWAMGIRAHEIRALLSKGWAQLSPTSRAVLGLVLVGIGLYASSQPTNYETGQYHLQSVRWIMDVGTVPGIANLYSNYAYTSSSYALSALLTFEPLARHPLLLLNAVMITVFAYRICVELSRCTPGWQVVWVGILICGIYGYRPFFHGLNADLLLAVLAWTVLSCVLSPSLAEELGTQSSQVWVVTLLTLWAITLKLSAAPIALLLLYVAWSGRAQLRPKHLYTAALLALLIVGPQVWRSILQSGYPLFPLTAFDWFDVDWKYPRALASSMREAVRNWNIDSSAQNTEMASLPISAWFPRWFLRLGLHDRILLVGICVSALAVPLTAVWRRAQRVELHLIIVWAICVLGAAFNLLILPGMRYVYPFASVAFLLALFMLLGEGVSANKFLRTLTWTCLWAFLAMNIVVSADQLLKGDHEAWWWRHSAVPIPVLATSKLGEHVVYLAPSGDDRCWDAPRPCTGYLPPLVELRGPSLRDGFRMRQAAPAP